MSGTPAGEWLIHKAFEQQVRMTPNAIALIHGATEITYLYGYRYGLEFLACATPAFALAAPHAGPVARKLLAPVLAVQLVVIALGAVVERVALDYRLAWTHNAFVDAMVAGSPALRMTAVLLVLLFLLVVRLVRTSAAPAPEVGEQVARPATVSFARAATSVSCL